MDEYKDREHLSNKIGRDAASATLKDFHDNFTKEVIPYEIEDTWVEIIYDAVGNVVGNKLIMRLRFNTYKKINVCQTEPVNWKTGYQTNCFAFSFKNSDLVSEMYNIIKNELSSRLRSHTLYKATTTKEPKIKLDIIKIKTDSNLLLLL